MYVHVQVTSRRKQIVQRKEKHSCIPYKYAYMCVCMYIQYYKYTYVYVHMQCAHVYKYVCVYACTCEHGNELFVSSTKSSGSPNKDSCNCAIALGLLGSGRCYVVRAGNAHVFISGRVYMRAPVLCVCVSVHMMSCTKNEQ